jgi:hippurate hydrolase
MTPFNNLVLNDLHKQMHQWRRHLHQYPETAFEEFASSQALAWELKFVKL